MSSKLCITHFLSLFKSDLNVLVKLDMEEIVA